MCSALYHKQHCLTVHILSLVIVTILQRYGRRLTLGHACYVISYSQGHPLVRITTSPQPPAWPFRVNGWVMVSATVITTVVFLSTSKSHIPQEIPSIFILFILHPCLRSRMRVICCRIKNCPFPYPMCKCFPGLNPDHTPFPSSIASLRR
ncbi:hypothetical protein BKA59DRAFT_200370 [Fusarium tricinctum]|uniref:Uncharacterized protein n=1 Tax=Fusarium tricinctum TaxID=61284 RepID=A0A8K0WBT2_9HYPO|nr:hypothetical protein BKA59DRAFT_200370 [Fusarium tricinctum]